MGVVPATSGRTTTRPGDAPHTTRMAGIPASRAAASRVASRRLAFATAIAGLLAVVVSTLAVPQHAVARPLDEVKASGVLRIAVYEANRPFSWRDDKGDLAGIDVELGRALAAGLGLAPEFIARMQGEDVDTDLRSNVWKGPVTGGQVADVMLHVPVDRELTLRNREAFIINPYFDERIALAFDPDKLGATPTLDTFRSHKIGVQVGTVADYFIMFTQGGVLRDNVLHFIKIQDGIRRFQAGEFSAILGLRSETEGWLAAAGAKASFTEVPMPGIQRARWNVGMAVKENSRDLGYALAAELDKLKAAGTLAAICRRYGVTYAEPPIE